MIPTYITEANLYLQSTDCRGWSHWTLSSQQHLDKLLTITEYINVYRFEAYNLKHTIQTQLHFDYERPMDPVVQNSGQDSKTVESFSVSLLTSKLSLYLYSYLSFICIS